MRARGGRRADGGRAVPRRAADRVERVVLAHRMRARVPAPRPPRPLTRGPRARALDRAAPRPLPPPQRPARACTTIAVGRDASATGSAMVTHSDDSGGAADLRMVRVRARDHPPGSKRPVYLSVGTFPRLFAPERALEYGSAQLPAGLELDPALYTPLGHIAQVSHTYGYHDTDYGVANEAGLVMGESTCATKLTSLPRGHVQPDESGRLRNGSALFGIDELSRVALERCATARCAARTMGEMAVRHGFYGGAALWGGQYGRNGAPMGSAESDKWGGLENSEGGESLVLADRSGEAWVFHVSPDDTGVSAVWAAQRVPDDQVGAAARAGGRSGRGAVGGDVTRAPPPPRARRGARRSPSWRTTSSSAGARPPWWRGCPRRSGRPSTRRRTRWRTRRARTERACAPRPIRPCRPAGAGAAPTACAPSTRARSPSAPA